MDAFVRYGVGMELLWDDVRVFLAAWEHTTLTAAAAALGLGQATVSRRIAAFEEQVGQKLFERHRNGLVPTRAGRALHPHAAQMAEHARLASASLQGLVAEPEGVVKVAAAPGIAVDLLPPLVPELRARHPKLRIEILSDNEHIDMTRHEADVAIRAFRPETGELVFRRLPSVPLAAYASRSYVERLPADAGPDALEWLQWSADLQHIGLARYVTHLLGGRPPILTSNSFLALRSAAQSGLGCMVLPALLARAAELVPVPLLLPPLEPSDTYLVIPHALRQVPRVAAVVDFLVEVVERLAEEEGWPRPEPTLPGS